MLNFVESSRFVFFVRSAGRACSRTPRLNLRGHSGPARPSGWLPHEIRAEPRAAAVAREARPRPEQQLELVRVRRVLHEPGRREVKRLRHDGRISQALARRACARPRRRRKALTSGARKTAERPRGPRAADNDVPALGVEARKPDGAWQRRADPLARLRGPGADAREAIPARIATWILWGDASRRRRGDDCEDLWGGRRPSGERGLEYPLGAGARQTRRPSPRRFRSRAPGASRRRS